MEALMPDEILLPGEDQPIFGLGAVTNLESQAPAVLDASPPKKQAFPILVLGLSGGIVGARVAGAKVCPYRLLAAAVAGAWAYRKLTRSGV